MWLEVFSYFCQIVQWWMQLDKIMPWEKRGGKGVLHEGPQIQCPQDEQGWQLEINSSSQKQEIQNIKDGSCKGSKERHRGTFYARTKIHQTSAMRLLESGSPHGGGCGLHWTGKRLMRGLYTWKTHRISYSGSSLMLVWFD